VAAVKTKSSNQVPQPELEKGSETRNKQVWFAVVDEFYDPNSPDVPPALFRGSVVYVNTKSVTDPTTGEHLPGVCKSIDPTVEGLYIVGPYDQWYEQKIRHLSIRATRPEVPIIGPFYTREKAIEARTLARHLTPDEENAVVAARNQELETENKAIRKQLEKLTAGK
jgi:hypothetical protein